MKTLSYHFPTIAATGFAFYWWHRSAGFAHFGFRDAFCLFALWALTVIGVNIFAGLAECVINNIVALYEDWIDGRFS